MGLQLQREGMSVVMIDVLAYTVPPWLQHGIGGADANYDEAYMLPCVKVRHRGGARDGEPTAGV